MCHSAKLKQIKYLLSLSFTFYSLLSFTQIINYFEDSPTWRTSTYDSGLSDGSGGMEEYWEDARYDITGTWSSGEYEYYAIQKYSQVTYADDMGEPSGFVLSDPMYFRQEEDAIYYYDFATESDSLFINYDLAVGEWFGGEFGAQNPGYTVERIDSVMVNGLYRKIYYTCLDSDECPQVIEGIGHLIGASDNIGDFFGSTFFGLDGIGFTTRMECFGLNNEAVWNYDNVLSDCAITLNNFHLQVEKVFTIAPNPFKTSITISAPTQIKTITVYNMHGAIVETIPTKTPSIQLDLSELEKGLYLIKTELLNGIIHNDKIIAN